VTRATSAKGVALFHEGMERRRLLRPHLRGLLDHLPPDTPWSDDPAALNERAEDLWIFARFDDARSIR
jgi:hypothetical protein